MRKEQFRSFLSDKLYGLSEESKGVKDFMAAQAYICCMNLLSEIIDKFDEIED